MKRYFALLDGGRGAVGVAFPDCPGCAAMGVDEDEAYANAVAALGEWIHDVIAALADGAVFLAVPLVIESGRPVKANISLDQGLLDAIDAAAKRSGLTRSAFLSSAAREKIAAAG